MFLGFMDENVAATFLFQLLDGSNLPAEPDAAPAFRVLGQGGLVTSGTGSLSSFESGSITGATNANPVIITSAGSNVSTGQRVTISGVGGNTAANGTFTATAVDGNRFSVPVAGNGAYTSGGMWRTTGLYKAVLSGAILASLEAGKTYTIVVTYAVSGTTYVIEGTFTVR